MIDRCKNLEELWEYVNAVNQKHFPDNSLMPIVGNGKTSKPKVMFVFINPTARNISSDPAWRGPRFPFIGTKQVWRIFHRAGLFDDGLMRIINKNAAWSLEFTDKVLNYLRKRSFYVTNIVKWTGHDAALPDSEKIRLFLPILQKEIALVRPEYIVTFGLIPFENITKQKIKLSDYHASVVKDKKLRFYERQFGSCTARVIPCYFPVGRGDPQKAVDILQLANAL